MQPPHAPPASLRGPESQWASLRAGSRASTRRALLPSGSRAKAAARCRQALPDACSPAPRSPNRLGPSKRGEVPGGGSRSTGSRVKPRTHVSCSVRLPCDALTSSTALTAFPPQSGLPETERSDRAMPSQVLPYPFLRALSSVRTRSIVTLSIEAPPVRAGNLMLGFQGGVSIPLVKGCQLDTFFVLEGLDLWAFSVKTRNFAHSSWVRTRRSALRPGSSSAG